VIVHKARWCHYDYAASYNQLVDITHYNYWWNEGGLNSDPDLSRLQKSPLHYIPRPISPAECLSDTIFTLRGARRVGKTVALKLLVKELIEHHAQHWKPRDILWLALDTVRTLAQAEELLTAVLSKYQPRLVMIDEITAVKGWQLLIKKLRDNGMLSDKCVILTGSSAHDLKAGAERMAGRRGSISNPDRVLLPLNFATFSQQLRGVGLLLSDQALIDWYLEVGGFPFRIEQFLRSQIGKLAWDPLLGMNVFDDVIFYEIIRRKLDRSIALEIIGRLAQIETSACSYEGFAKPLSVTKDTARKYLDAFGDSFLLSTFSAYDTGRARVAPRKDRKFAWIDPSLGFIAAHLGQGQPASVATRAEWLTGVALLTHHERRLFEGLSAPRNVFTWRSAKGKELDYLVVDKTKKLLIPVEVKFQNTIADWDFQSMERAFGRGVLVTKSFEGVRPKSVAMSLGHFLDCGAGELYRVTCSE
jgi:predicted AAA+ superfamily ATPase